MLSGRLQLHFPLNLLLSLLLLAPTSCREKSELELQMEQLDNMLSLKSTYAGKFNIMLDSFKSVAKSSTSLAQKYEMNKEVASEYMYYSMDSALVYINRNLDLAGQMSDRKRFVESELMKARLYSRAGYLSDAEDIVKDYDSFDSIPEGLEYDYYNTMCKVYGELGAFTSIDRHWERRDRCLDSLVRYSPPETFEYYDAVFTKAMAQGDGSLCLECLHNMLDKVKPEDRRYAWTTYFLSIYDPAREDLWLIRSSITDIMCATRDYSSLTVLARNLYDRGEYVRAFRYIADHCMKDAILYNGKLRPWQIAAFFPAMIDKYEEISRTHRHRLVAVIVVVAILLAVLAVLSMVLLRRQRLLMVARAELEASKADLENKNLELIESNKVKQEYLALYLGYLSENIGANRHYRNHVLKYIKKGMAATLVEEIESGQKNDDDVQDFYDMFDKTFLNLYPGFIDKFNSLLAEGEEIVPKGGDNMLTPELRVFALIKLGITDSASIARLLHYSVNTIYNYRAKVRNKARGDRESFEDEVHKLS